MTIDRLLQQADYFAKLAQLDQYDDRLRNLVVNTRPDANNFSFREVASVVLQDLAALDRNEADATITTASHGLLDILNALTVPNPTGMLNAAQQAANIIRQKYPQDTAKQKIANYLVRIVQLLINKYFAAKNTESISNDMATEGSPQFLTRLYQSLRHNQPISEADRSTWQAGKAQYTRRLAGLTGLSSLTPVQQQEKDVITYVLTKMQ